MSAVCATPPHLEGATLQEIPLDSLNCNGNVNRNSNANVLHQLEVRSRQNNMTFVNRFSDGVSDFIEIFLVSNILQNLTKLFRNKNI